jgi:hypothetical protein
VNEFFDNDEMEGMKLLSLHQSINQSINQSTVLCSLFGFRESTFVRNDVVLYTDSLVRNINGSGIPQYILLLEQHTYVHTGIKNRKILYRSRPKRDSRTEIRESSHDGRDEATATYL